MTPEDPGVPLDARRLVEEAFQRTFTPAPPGLAHRVRERLWQERLRSAGRGGWWPALAVGTAVCALLAGLLLSSGYLDWRVTGPEKAAPTSDTMAQQGSPGVEPEATFLVPSSPGDPAAPLRRVDWTGRTVGRFVRPDGAAVVVPSADGALVEVPDPGAAGGDVLDAGGATVAHLAAFGAWSSDGAHVACALDLSGPAPRTVVTDLRGAAGPRQTVRTVTGDHLPAEGWSLWGCSAGGDSLVAVRLEHDGGRAYALAEVDLVQLSTGRVRSYVAYPGQTFAVAPVLSHDGRYLAENDADRRSAAIRDLLTGEVVGHVGGMVAAFSGDDRLVLVNGGGAGPAAPAWAAIVDWRWARTVWTRPGQAVPLAERPGGLSFALSLSSPPDGPARTLLVPPGRAVIDLDPPAPAAPVPQEA